MKLVTFRHTLSEGWDIPFPDLDSPQTLLMIFGSPKFLGEPEQIQELTHAYPASHIIGCSTAGEIFGKEITDDSIVVAVMQFAATKLISVALPVQDADSSYQVGSDIAHQLFNSDLKGVIILSEGININGTQLIEGLNSVLPPRVTITGGLAGDGSRFEHTWIIKDGKPQEGYISAVGLYGDYVRISHGSQGGWDTFGQEYHITKSKNNILYEIDNQPALQLYKEYLQERATELPASALLFPLALRSKRGDWKQLVRTVLGVDEASQSMTFAGDMPEGYTAQFMHATFDQLIRGAAGAALRVQINANKSDTLVVAISCVGRRLVLKERTKEELNVMFKVFPDFVKQIGFYSYGEISPFTTGVCDLHNQTMTLTSISEVTV